MSKYVDEIIKDIKTNPQTWKRYRNDGLYKNNIIIQDCGNGSKFLLGWFTSIVDVFIEGKNTPKTWRDCYRLEEAFIWWMRNASLSMLSV